MKLIKLTILFFTGAFTFGNSSAQNVSLNILTGNSGHVNLGGTVFLQVDVTNTDLSGTLVANKVRPQISVPVAICSIAVSGHNLPTGWTITSNSGSVIRITNTSDPIPPNTTRTSYIAIQGNAVGGPSNISGNLTFVGAAPSGENSADNSSSSAVEVINPIPITLTDFSAKLVNCQPSLKWVTETEINSDRFEIERGNVNNTNWSSIGVVAARGYSSNKTEYNFTDRNTGAAEKSLYRLKMIDKDGHYKYSKTLPVFVNCKTASVYVYPNPVQDGKLYISLTGTNGNATISLVSMTGQVIVKSKINNGTDHINVAGIANGTYILNITDANGADKKVKVIIQN